MIRWLIAPEPGPLDPRELSATNTADAVRAATEAISGLDYRFGGGHARRMMATCFETEVAPILRTANPGTPTGPP
jgi:hypothetical protein